MNSISEMKNDLPFDSVSMPEKKLFVQNCKKCNGSGFVTIGWTFTRSATCFACKGKGKLSFRTSPEQRERAKSSVAAKKERDIAQAWNGFVSEQPEVAAWILSSKGTFEFASALEQAVLKWGKLTEKQLAAAQKCLNARKASQEARSAATESAPSVTLESVEKAFQNAKQAGIKYPKLNLDVFTFSPAPITGNNAGAIYVKSGDQYLGKVMGGKFLKTRDCSDEQQSTIQQVAADPKAAAVAYGKRFGSCSICRRELTNEDSINLGIGPICAGKFGW
jgi:hypothetical protein